MTLNETIDKYKMLVENCQKRINHSGKMGYKDKEIYTEWKDEYQQMVDWLEELKKYKDSQPCEDCVSRKDVHDMLENLPVTVENHWFNWLQKACIRLAELPSVQPSLRKGKWLVGYYYYPHFCSNCNYSTNDWDEMNFCPKCGSDMREE